MPRILVLLIVAVLSRVSSAEAAVQAANVNYRRYQNYAIDPKLPTSIGLVASLEICAVICANSVQFCFAATYTAANSTCAILEGCGHLALVGNSSGSVTIVNEAVSNSYISKNPKFDIPLVKNCGYLNLFGNASLPSAPTLNYPAEAGDQTTPWIAAPITFLFTTSSSASFSSGTYIAFEDSVNYQLDLFSSGSSFSIAFYILPKSSNNRQGAIVFTTSISNGKNCLLVFVNNYCSNATHQLLCLQALYFPGCDGLGDEGNSTWNITTSIVQNAWQHIAYVYDTAAAQTSCFKDGVLVSSAATSVNRATQRATMMIVGNSRLIYYSFGGSIACLQLYTEALTPSDLGKIRSQCVNGSLTLT